MKKIIFDLDNTLLFISSDWSDSYQAFIDKYNLDITPQDLFFKIGCFERDLSGVVNENDLCNYINNKLNLNITYDMVLDLLSIYENIPLRDTDMIYDVLEYLSNKYELIAYTNWFTNIQTGRLKNYNLDKFFSRIYGWDILPIKPSEEGIKSIIGNDDINDYIMIGDNIKIDLEVPHSMGMDTILYNRKGIEQNIYKEIVNISELKNIL